MAKSGKLARLIRDLDGPELTRLMGCSRSMVYRWQQGQTLPSDESLPHLALASGLRFEDLWKARQADRIKARK